MGSTVLPALERTEQAAAEDEQVPADVRVARRAGVSVRTRPRNRTALPSILRVETGDPVDAHEQTPVRAVQAAAAQVVPGATRLRPGPETPAPRPRTRGTGAPVDQTFVSWELSCE